ncbi:MAG TPA: MFS transporter [Actinocrinis sp.]|nr:MFS transporter [Actinocrinis sp.]
MNRSRLPALFRRSAAPAPSARAARAATFVYFVLNGFVMGTWVVHIPLISHQAGIVPATLGWLLLGLGASAFVGLRLFGPLTDRFGARRTVPVAAALCSASLVLPALAHGVWPLAGGLVALGVGNGSLDVSMNTHAVKVEGRYDRPVMSAFHATWSLGGVMASIVGARTISWGWPLVPTFLGIAALGLLTAVVTAPFLLPLEREERGVEVGAVEATAGAEPRSGVRARDPKVVRRVWALAAVAFMVMLAEGVAYDWSTVQLRDDLHAAAATAALAYGAFATAATLGRLCADRVAARIGPAALVRWGSALAAAGFTTTALSHQTGVAIVGWAVAGLGLAGGVPQLFTAAGNVDQRASGANVARVAGLGYVGMLAGPSIIGPLTHVMTLSIALLLPAGLCVVAAYAAGIVRPVGGAVGGDDAGDSGDLGASSDPSDSVSAVVMAEAAALPEASTHLPD